MDIPISVSVIGVCIQLSIKKRTSSFSEFHCDAGYLLFGDHCYHFESERAMNWQDAENYCSNQNGHLASFQAQEELSFMTGE